MESSNVRLAAAVLWPLLFGLLAGCGGQSPVPSNTVPTANIYAYMQAVQNGSGDVTTTVELRDGPGVGARYLYLNGGDVLYSSLDKPPLQYLSLTGDLFGGGQLAAEELKVLSARNLYIDYILFEQVVYGQPEYYSVARPTAGAATVRAYVEFVRSGNSAAGTSSIDLPPGFQITAPASESSVNRATPVTLTWNNVDAAYSMRLNVGSRCDDGTQNTWSQIMGADTGTTTVSSASYLPALVSGTANCRIIFILERYRTGAVSPNLLGGTFEGVQQRTVQFTTTP